MRNGAGVTELDVYFGDTLTDTHNNHKLTRLQSFKSARLLGVEVHNDFDCVSINKA